MTIIVFFCGISCKVTIDFWQIKHIEHAKITGIKVNCALANSFTTAKKPLYLFVKFYIRIFASYFNSWFVRCENR